MRLPKAGIQIDTDFFTLTNFQLNAYLTESEKEGEGNELSQDAFEQMQQFDISLAPQTDCMCKIVHG